MYYNKHNYYFKIIKKKKTTKKKDSISNDSFVAHKIQVKRIRPRRRLKADKVYQSFAAVGTPSANAS
jgi:hypothetical protein